MSRQLPPNPSLTNLKKQAKSLLKSQKEGDASCCDTLRLLRRFKDVSDEGILSSSIGLQETQHALAKDYGYMHWPELRRAVSAESITPESRVKRDGDKVWIEGIGCVDGRNSFVGSIVALGKHLGSEMTFDSLMGASGAAFRLMFHQPDWCPSSPDPTCGFDHAPALTKASGYKFDWIQLFEEKKTPENQESARIKLMASIDKGYPVIGIDLRVCPEWGLVVGYEDDGRKLLCRTIFDGPEPEGYAAAEKWPWILYIVEGHNRDLSERDIVMDSFRIAVEIAQTKSFKKYASGFAAFEAWSNDLKDDARFDDADDDQYADMCHANKWSYRSLSDARKGAVKYLQSVISLFDEEIATPILEASRIYEHIVQKLTEGASLSVGKKKVVEDRNAWTQEMRHGQATVLREVVALEREAIANIEKAISVTD